MNAVLESECEHERGLGNAPREVTRQDLGYDIESRPGDGGPLRFIEVKDRPAGADTVNVTRNEMMVGLNEPDQFILAVVEVDGGEYSIHCVRRPFDRLSGFGTVVAMLRIPDLLTRAEAHVGGR